MILGETWTITDWIESTVKSILLTPKSESRKPRSNTSLTTWCKKTQQPLSQMWIVFTGKARRTVTLSTITRIWTIKAEHLTFRLTKTGTTSRQSINFTTSATKIAFNCSSRTRMSTGRELKSTGTWFNSIKSWMMARSAECLGAQATRTRWKHLVHSSDNTSHRHSTMACLITPKNEWLSLLIAPNWYLIALLSVCWWQGEVFAR